MEESIFEHCFHYLLLLRDIYTLIQFLEFLLKFINLQIKALICNTKSYLF